MSGVQNITKGQEEERDSETARLSAAATVTSHQQVTFNLEPDEDTDAALKQLIADITTAVRQKLPPAEQRALLGSLRATLEGHQRGTGGGDGGGEGGGDGGAADSEYGGDGGGGVIEPHALEKVLVLASYSPAEVVHRFASIPPAELRMLAEPEKHDFVAAVGFVDVSGFTKLSEKLASEHGRAGAEMLNVYVNAYFAKLIDGINRYAGDVIKFAGDALQVIWRNRPDGTQDSPATLMLRSAACCLYLLKNLNGFKPAEGVSLTLHMGVGVGMMSEFYVGGCAGKWEYFVAGEPIEQMSDAAEEATSGELVISGASKAAYEADGEAQGRYELGGRPLESGQFLLESITDRGGLVPARQAAGGGSALDSLVKRSLLDGMRDSLTARGPDLEPFLRCFVPALVEERLDAGQSGAALHEHRKLISVFMKVLGLGPKPCDVESLDVVQQATLAIQKAVQRYDGAITRLITDDKGTRFLIAFGLPGHQHDHDEERAVLSSLEVVAALDAIPAWTDEGEEEGSNGSLQVAVGITTGLVFCGEAGWVRNRVEYTLAGAKVNLAARLMQASSKLAGKEECGIVLCDQETYEACNASASCGCSWNVLAAIQVKGKDEPVPIFQPVGQALSRDSTHSRSRTKGKGAASSSSTPTKRARSATNKKVALFGTYGRAGEKRKLEELLLDLVVRGHGSLLVLRGDSGMGKTHILEEIKAIKACITVDGALGARRRFTPTSCTITATTSEIEGKTPFFMWKDIFERCLSPDTQTKLSEHTAHFQPSDAAASSSSRPPAPPTPRQRWQHAVATTISYLYPPGVADQLERRMGCAVEFVIRPQADALLLTDQLVLQHAPLLSPVLPEPIKDNQWTKQLSGEARKEATIHVMARVLELKLGGAHSTLMFDDTHWMDSSSWALLNAVRGRVQPLLLVLTTRPMAETDPNFTKIEAHLKDLESLTELTRPDIDELIRNQLGVTGQVEYTLSSAITTRSGGNPFFAKGFVTSFVEQGVLDISKDTIELAEGMRIADVDFPSSVETLITSRIDRLPVADQMLLKVAAVVACSGTFTEAQLPPMLRAGGLELPAGTTILAVLRSLRDADMLSCASTKPGNAAFGFKHASVQTVACHVLSQELKLKLHRAAAEDCEAQYGALAEPSEASGELLQLLAHHWRRAEGARGDGLSSRKAGKYLLLCGDRAMAAASASEASQHFTEALEIATSLESEKEEVGPLLRRLGECHVQQGNYTAAGKCLDRALVCMGGEEVALLQISEREVKSRLDAVRAQQFRVLAIEAVATPLKRIGSLLRKNSSRRQSCPEPSSPSLLRSSSASLSETSAPREAGPEVLQTPGPPPSEGKDLKLMELALAYELMSRVAMQEHDVPLASYCATRALQLGQQLEHLTPVVARAYASLCLTSAADKRQREALRFKDLALSSCKVLGEQGLLSNTLMVAAVNEAGQGSWSAAVSNLHEAIQISKEIGDKWQWEESTSHMAHLEFYRGHFGASRLLYEQASASAKIRRDKKMINRCQAGIASILLATGDFGGALQILRTTNSYGPTALALMRAGEQGEAYSMALKVKDRFKGRRTKYYVLKSFVAVCDVFLQLYESSVRNRDLDRKTSDRQSSSKSGRIDATLPAGSSSARALPKSAATFLSSPPSNQRVSGGSAGESSSAEPEQQAEDPDTLQAMCQEWIDKLTQFSTVYALASPRTLLCRGRLRLISGSPAEGLKLLRKSQQLAAKMQMPYDEALALQLLSRHTKGSARESQQAAQEAQQIFARLGVDPGL